MKRLMLVALVLSFFAMPALAQETPRPGGVLKAAMIGEPPWLDLRFTFAARRKELRGFPATPWLCLWNTWLAS